MIYPRVSTLESNPLDTTKNKNIDRGFGIINED
jgi:hypothetical protein